MEDCLSNLNLDDEVLAWLSWRAEEMGGLTVSEVAASIVTEQMEADVDARFDAMAEKVTRSFPNADIRTEFVLPKDDSEVSDWAIRVFVKTAGSQWRHVVTQFGGGRFRKIGEW
jgi:hypothetical protein